jgi:hypothetical protein
VGDVARPLDGGRTARPARLARAGASLWASRGADDPVARNLYLEFAWVGVLNAAIATFAPVFTIRLGGSPLLVAALASGPALAAILVSLPAARFLRPQPMQRILWARVASRLPYLGIALVPWLISEHQAAAVVALVTLSYLPAHVAYVGFTSVFADLVPPARRAVVMSTRLLALGLVSSATVLVGGWMLDVLPFPLGYQILFVAGFASSIFALRYWRRLPTPAGAAPGAEGAATLRDAEAASAPGAAPSLTGFSVSTFTFQLGIGMAVPLLPIYWVSELGLADGRVGLIATAAGLASVAAYPLWGRLATRRGNVPMLGAALLVHSFYPILTASTRDPDLLLGVGVLGGLASAGTTLGLVNGLLVAAPAEDRLRFVGAYNTLTYLALSVGPVAGSLAAGAVGVPVALLVAGTVRLVGTATYGLWARSGA